MNSDAMASKGFHFYFALLGVSLGLVITILYAYDFSQFNIYWHDALYYNFDYTNKLKNEGRWINFLLFSVLKRIPGQLAVFLNILFFFLFSFIVSYRWTRKFSYSVIFSIMLIHIGALSAQLLWPATILPAFFVLFVAALVAPYMSISRFYFLFGILFFGMMSNLYYLLPLLHLNLLNTNLERQNFKTLMYKILPVWAGGFVAGYLFSLLSIYLLAGQIGMSVASWREPNYVNDIQSLKKNITASATFLLEHILAIFSGFWLKLMIIMAIIVGSTGSNIRRRIPLILLSTFIVLAHYVIIIPIGINIAPRTIIATWVGMLVVSFLYRDLNNWRYYVLVTILLLLTLSFYIKNHDNLRWYSSMVNTYYNQLLSSTPRPPRQYKGLLILATNDDVKILNNRIEKKLNLSRGWGFQGLDAAYRMRPAAYEAGFKKVFVCKSWHRNVAVCKKANSSNRINLTQGRASSLYRTLGEVDGYLVADINPQVQF